jgi:thioredoxin 1
MKTFLLLIGLVFVASAPGIAQSQRAASSKPMDTSPSAAQPTITFVELGSVNCLPCKAMQPVMRSIQDKYGSQINVVFHDIWKEDQAHFARQYNVRLIPTQVFLDASGKELLRHEGFFPEKDIDAFLQTKGLKPRLDTKG